MIRCYLCPSESTHARATVRLEYSRAPFEIAGSHFGGFDMVLPVCAVHVEAAKKEIAEKFLGVVRVERFASEGEL